ncbi:MAG: hypothetical protein AB1Z98_26165 [Nannocystaceae bacterium]
MRLLPNDALLRAVMVLLIAWPPVHMVLIPALGISTWRFGGWGMYATPVPRRSHVAVIGRDCVLPPRLIDRDIGMRGLVLSPGAFQYGALSVDAIAHDLSRDVTALRRDTDIIALDTAVRHYHGIDQSSPLALVVAHPRIRMQPPTAFALATVFVLRDGVIVERAHEVASVGMLDTLLPRCGEPS